MKTEAFLTLDAVVRTGTLAAAAAEMHVTPSAVSMQMKQLERYLGKPLFDRSGLQVRPLPIARQVAATMMDALRSLETLRHVPTRSIEGKINLGVIDSMQPVTVPNTLRLLRDQHPRLQIRLTRGKSTQLTAAVKAGEIDAAIVAQPENGGSMRLDWQPLMRRELMLIAPPGAEDMSFKALFRHYDWIRYDTSTITGRQAARFVNQHAKDKRGSDEFDSARLIVAMVSAGLGISVLQLVEPAVCLSYPVRLLRLGTGAPVVQMALVTRQEDRDSRQLDALRRVVADVLAEAPVGHANAQVVDGVGKRD
jgi:DNA-binding transcriptional LysR family regulator